MRILSFMQNQWFKDPAKVKAIYARNPDKRNYFIRTFLFMGCLSGRRLQKALGEELCRQIVWEEASPEIGGASGSSFGADEEHIKAAIRKHAPEIIICFGKISGDAVRALDPHVPVLYAPHPAARRNPSKELAALPAQIEALKNKTAVAVNGVKPTNGNDSLL
jgi:hypothetical protein